MALATLTQTGRAAIALAISSRPLHLAWGSGDPCLLYTSDAADD